MQVVVDEILTHYETQGQGPTILLLHGWGQTIASFHDLSVALSPNYLVVAVDLPGFGQSEPPPLAWGLDEYAAFVRDFAKKLGLSFFAIVGHSNGGAVAVRGLSQNYFHSQRLVLLAAAGVRQSDRRRVGAIKMMTKTGKLLTRPLPDRWRKKLRAKVYSSVGSDMLLAEHLQDSFKKVVGDDIQSDAEKLKLPTLIIYGQNDQTTPVERGKILHNLIQGSQLVVIEHAGHFVQNDQPAQVDKAVLEFLR